MEKTDNESKKNQENTESQKFIEDIQKQNEILKKLAVKFEKLQIKGGEVIKEEQEEEE